MSARFPTAHELAELTLSQQHPISLAWQPTRDRLDRLTAEHGIDVQLATDMDLARRRRDRFAPGQPAEMLLNRWTEARPGLQVVLSPRYEGGDPTRPFIDVSACTDPITQWSDVTSVAQLAIDTFRALRPRYLRWWTASAPVSRGRRIGAVASDKRFLAAPLRTLADTALPESSPVVLERAENLDHYADAVAAYQSVDLEHPDHRRQAAIEDRDRLAELALARTVFDVLLEGTWIGYVAAAAGHKLGLAGYKIAELVLDPRARGHAYGHHLITLLSRELIHFSEPDAVLIGTIHPRNVGAIQAAYRSGRHDIGGWNVTELELPRPSENLR